MYPVALSIRVVDPTLFVWLRKIRWHGLGARLARGLLLVHHAYVPSTVLVVEQFNRLVAWGFAYRCPYAPTYRGAGDVQ